MVETVTASVAASRGLRVEIRRKAYDSPPTLALEEVDFTVAAGQFVALVGPSGAGKSTLLNIVAGLDRDFQGEVASSAGGAAPSEAPVGYVFQTPRLLPWLSVLENVRLVLPRGAKDMSGALELLAEVGLEGFEDAYPGQLSGGMQRRVALARAFCVKPSLLLMDEPFASLDEPLAWRLRGQLIELWQRYRPTVLFVTHDLTEALTLAGRVLFLSARPGRIVHDQPVELAYPRAPGDPAVEHLRVGLLERYPNLLSGYAGPSASAAGAEDVPPRTMAT